MAPGSGPDGVVPTPEARAIQELAAARREMVAAVTRQIRFSIEQLQLSPQEAAARVREWLAHAPADQEADQVTWFDLAGLIEHDPERGQAAWQTLKDEARQELATGFRAARTLEPPVTGRPYERAQVMVIVEALRQALEPRDVLEELLVQHMASAYELNLRWQALVVRRMETEVWQGSGTGSGRWRTCVRRSGSGTSRWRAGCRRG